MRTFSVSISTAKKLNQIVLKLAQGYSNRAIGRVLHIDRNNYKAYFISSSTKYLTIKSPKKIKQLAEFLNKIRCDILKNKLTYEQVHKKYGSKGLSVLYFGNSLAKANHFTSLTDKIIELRNQNKSFKQISKKLGIGEETASVLYRKKMGIEKTENITKKIGRITRDRILELYKKGHSAIDIARLLEKSISLVTYWLNKVGIHRRKNSFTIEQLLKIYKLREIGATWAEIAYVMDVPQTRIASYYRNHILEVYKWLQPQQKLANQ